MRKKKVLFHSNYCGSPTGFGGFMREILGYLYKTDKYELTLYASGVVWDHIDYQRWPWKIYGALPLNEAELNGFDTRLASYGAFNLDKVIEIVQPDIYIGVEDFWGVEFAITKSWWNKINSVIVWTADSLPLLERAVEAAPKILNHYVWADFARQEFHRLNFTNVKTLRGTVDTNTFKKLSADERQKLRLRHGLPENIFTVGSLSRNQLRKLWPNLLEGFKKFQDDNPEINTKLLLYTHWSEPKEQSWDIPRLIKEFGIKNEDVLACYKCRETNQYYILPFAGQDLDNPEFGNKKSLITVNLNDKLSNEQLNEWYNLLDCFCLPITSGGQERAIQEAKLCELITLVNDYSCGKDMCVPEAESLILEYASYREVGSGFIKASPYPKSIAEKLKLAYSLYNSNCGIGKRARQWVLNNFSIEIVGKQYEEIIDNLPLIEDYKFTQKQEEKLPNAPVENIADDKVWVKTLYKNILKMDVGDSDEGFLSWQNQLVAGQSRAKVEEFFRNVALEKNAQLENITLRDLIDKNGKKTILVVLKESIGDIFMATSLFESIKQSYPEYDIYFSCEEKYHEIMEGNPWIYKCVPYIPAMESELLMTGSSNVEPLFNAYINLGIGTQRQLNYLTNNNLSLELAVEL